MKKANVAGLEKMAAGFLQHRYEIYLRTKSLREPDPDGTTPDFIFYDGACKMIEAFGGEWYRRYSGGDTEEELDDIRNYHHIVYFPSDDKCSRLNFEAWE